MELQTFSFDSMGVRVMEIDGEPWFVAKDVAKVLGYTNTQKAVRDHCKAPQHVGGERIVHLAALHPQTTIIPERDVYRLIMRSKLPAAEAFEEWVVGTVLPAIRKDGAYIAGEENLTTGELSEDELVLRAMSVLQNKVTRIAAERDGYKSQTEKHLEYMTVNEFFALKHIYPGRGDSIALGHRASKLCKQVGYERRTQERYHPGTEQMVSIYEYPVEALEHAYAGLVERGRIPENIPQQMI